MTLLQVSEAGRADLCVKQSIYLIFLEGAVCKRAQCQGGFWDLWVPSWLWVVLTQVHARVSVHTAVRDVHT